jgi:23S rRNA (adenine2503-C2)-methyltransferase
MDNRIHLKNLPLKDLESFLLALDPKPFRAAQVARWLYGRGARSFEEMKNLSKGFRRLLAEKARISWLEPREIQSSPDGTCKFRFILEDGEGIESVLLPERDHWTLCLSTQVGCGLGCKFCLTGRRGWIRNLTPAEIIDQVLAVGAALPAERRIRNLVFMGMGEPLLNFENLIRAIEVLRSPGGLQFSHRHITVSTAGLIPQMEALASRRNFAQLAISLNASSDEQRTQLMPVNRKYPLRDLLAACRRLPLANREKITFEYVLIRGLNDSAPDAIRVDRLLKGVPAKINLIPFNEHPGISWKRPEEETVSRFRKVLMDAGYTAVIRQSKGKDILAACGQLGGQEALGERDPGLPTPRFEAIFPIG